MEISSAVQALASLAQNSRLLIFKALVQAGPQGLQPSTLTAQLAIPANTLSFHLKDLLSAHLITQERCGRALFYRANFERTAALVAYLTVNCCGGQPCGIETTTNLPSNPIKDGCS